MPEAIQLYGATELVKLQGAAEPVGVLKDMLKKSRKDCIREWRLFNADLAKRHFADLLESGAISKDQQRLLHKEIKKRLKQDFRVRGVT